MSKATISVRLEQDTLDQLSAMARATGRKRAALMTHAIEKYVEDEAWQLAAIQQALDELERGEADLVDHEDVVRWLESWGSAQETDPPACE